MLQNIGHHSGCIPAGTGLQTAKLYLHRFILRQILSGINHLQFVRSSNMQLPSLFRRTGNPVNTCRQCNRSVRLYLNILTRGLQ